MKLARVFLKAGKDKPVRNFHPWVFSGAIDSVDDFHKPGDLVKVHANDRSPLGIGYLNPKSQIAVRMLSFVDATIDESFFARRIEQALAMRKEFMSSDTNSYRLVHSEGDFLPGLIVDRYANFLVAQFQTLGMERLKPLILPALQAIEGIDGIYERADSQINEWEGMKKDSQSLFGGLPPALLEILECGNSFLVDLHHGQKTGFFLDQRENRKLVGAHAENRRVLNCFSYSGGFSVFALKGGASHVTSVDSSKDAGELCLKNLERNSLASDLHDNVTADVFEFLRKDSNQYDLIILDPPAFCRGSQQVNEAARGYKDINLNAMKKVKSGGLLFSCSCSSYVTSDLFQKILFAAAKDIRREVKIIKKTAHSADHPVNLYHPEGEYLKAFLCQMV